MNIKQAIEKFRSGKTVVNVQTEQEWVEFMKLLEEHSDMKWISSGKPTRNMWWGNHKGESCVTFKGKLMFGSTSWYMNHGKEIITFQDFKKLYQKENDMKEFTKSDLKDYMKVVHRNGEERIAKGGTLSNDYGYAVISQVLTNGLTWVYEGNTNKEFDVVEVYEPTLDGWNLLWKREEPKYYLVYPKEMYHVERILCYSTQDDVYFDKPIDFKYRVQKSFTQEEIDAIPFNTDMFEKREV